MSAHDRRATRRADAVAFTDAEAGVRVWKPKEKGGPWRYSHKDPVTDARVVGRFYGTRAEVGRQYDRLRKDLLSGRDSKWQSMTFRQLAELYLADAKHQWEPPVRRGQTQKVGVLLDDTLLGNAKLGRLVNSPMLLRSALEELSTTIRQKTGRPFAQASLRTYRDLLGTIISWGLLKEKIPPGYDPMKKVSTPAAAHGAKVRVRSELLDDDDDGDARRRITPAEIPNLAAAERLAAVWVDRAPGRPWFRWLAIMLAAVSGLRWGEIHALRPCDFVCNGDEPHIRVGRKVLLDSGGKPAGFSKPKGGKTRRALLAPHLIPAVLRRCAEVEAEFGRQGLMFPSPMDPTKVYAPDSFTTSMRRYAARAGWPVDEHGLNLWSFHSLRHLSAVILLRDVGLDIGTVSESHGHGSCSFTFDRYMGTDADSYSIASKKLGAWGEGR